MIRDSAHFGRMESRENLRFRRFQRVVIVADQERFVSPDPFLRSGRPAGLPVGRLQTNPHKGCFGPDVGSNPARRPSTRPRPARRVHVWLRQAAVVPALVRLYRQPAESVVGRGGRPSADVSIALAGQLASADRNNARDGPERRNNAHQV